MAELLKYVEGGILSDREYWKAGRENEIIVSIEGDICSISVTDKNKNNISELISAFLKVKKINHKLISTIDSHMIELKSTSKNQVIELIDREW